MGTRYEDQPVEQWSGPESLDPTPVWKQYILVAALLFVGLALVVGISVTALWPNFVTPPALVPGDRLVLSAFDIPAVGQPPKLVKSPIIDDARSFYLVQPEKGQVLAMRVRWAYRAGADDCEISPAPGRPAVTQFVGLSCSIAFSYQGSPLFDLRGQPTNPYYRGLDQYLVSVSGDRVVVNLSRVIQASERTSGPVPTGIPQPQTQQP
jgi:hypothetical protein